MKWIFFIAFPGAILGLNLFLAWAAWRLFSPHKKLQIAAAGTSVAVLVLFALSFLGFLMRAQDNVFFAFAWEFLAFAVVPMIYLAIWALAGTLIVKIFSKLSRFKIHFAVAGVLLVAAVCTYGFWKFENPRVVHLIWNPETRELTQISGKPKLHARMRIVATADWHLGTRISRERTEKFVRLVNAQNPDLLLIAGDLIDGRIEPVEAEKLDEIMREIHAPLGVFASFGNHEYFGDIPRQKAFFKRANVRLLQDESVLVDDGAGTQIRLVGRDDAINRFRLPLKNLLERKPAEMRENTPTLVLDHQPKGASEAAVAGADFVFSGHTHAGQLWPGTWLVSLFNPHVHGIWRERETLGYVTSGIGLWHIPYRIGSQSELVVIYVE